MKDIILLNPPPVVLKDSFAENVMFANPPLGIGYLATALRKKNFNVDLFDMAPERMKLKNLEDEIKENSIPIVGISSFVANHGNGMRIAKFIKETFSNVKVIMGGPQASFLCEEVLESGYVDVISLFEGEETIPELVDALLNNKDLSNVKGIAYVKDGFVVRTEKRELITDLDSLGFPAWDLYELSAYTNPGVVLTGRGCPYQCIFCSAGAIAGGKYRMRSTKSVVDELEYLNKTYNIKDFFFADDTFTASAKHCIDICHEIRRRKLNIHWEAEARANTVTDHVVCEMAKAGCRHVQIGAESGDNDILKIIGKNVTTDTIENAVMTFLQHGITTVCSFILGNPKENVETVDKTIKFAVHLKNLTSGHSSCKFSFLTPLPGTPVYERRDEWGIRLLTNNWDKYSFIDVVCESDALPKKVIQNKYLQAWVSYTKGEFLESLG